MVETGASFNILEEIKEVEGWLYDDEAIFLYNQAKKCTGQGIILEVGSWKGKSTICLGKGSKHGGNIKIYAVDPHINSAEAKHLYGDAKVTSLTDFLENIKKAQVDGIVFPIVKTSKDASKEFDQPIEFLFIDGEHEGDAPRLDFEYWSPKLISNGVIAFHDVGHSESIKKIFIDLVENSDDYTNVQYVGSIGYATKIR